MSAIKLCDTPTRSGECPVRCYLPMGHDGEHLASFEGYAVSWQKAPASPVTFNAERLRELGADDASYIAEVERVSGLLVDLDGDTRFASISEHVADLIARFGALDWIVRNCTMKRRDPRDVMSDADVAGAIAEIDEARAALSSSSVERSDGNA